MGNGLLDDRLRPACDQIIDVDTRNDDIGDATILLDPISDNYINLSETTSNTLVYITGSTTAVKNQTGVMEST